MRLKVYSVYDTLTGAYMTPNFAISHGQVHRSFGDACNDANSPFHKHPGDYRVDYIGDFEDTTGELVPRKPEPVAQGAEFARKD